jgi:serine protease Do
MVRDFNTLAFWLGLFGVLVWAIVTALPTAAHAESGIREVPEDHSDVQLSYAPVVREVSPAVVNVYSTRVVQQFRSPFAADPFFDRFFGGGGMREQEQHALGSGVIVSADGIIVTNNHVIQGSEEVTVALADRREFRAEVILADERTDLAVLRIDPGDEELPTVAFRNSDSLQVGDLVLAIGNPFGVGQTVTSGIVSALARTQIGVSDYQFFIQTDAAVNPGNSGGALVTLDGGLVGINTAIFSRTGGSIGIGFAIPSNMVRRVVESAIDGTPITRAWLGLGSQEITSDIASSLNLSRLSGALVNNVYPGGPADRAGLKSGDIVTSLGGHRIDDPSGLRYRVGVQRPGDELEIEYARNGRTRTARITLEVPPETPPRSTTDLSGPHPFNGATVANLSPAFNNENGLDPFQEGVVILGMQRGSTAWRLRLQAGDIIREVNGESIDDVDELQRATGGRQGRWDVMIERGGREFTFSVRG